MDKNSIKKYAVWARRELISRVSQKALQYGVSEKESIDAAADTVNGHLLSGNEKKQRQALINRIKQIGYQQTMEEAAYTWFNRFSALRFMEVNGYLPTHVRVFTDEQNAFKPQILAEAIHMELDGLSMDKVYELKDANKTDELYKYLLITQCNALSAVLPGMFTRIEDYTELLFPDNLLREGSVIEQMISMIPEEDWKDAVQIIGWLYQYYNVEPKDKVFADLKKNIKISKENIPAATQLFTPDWIVRYMVENSLGRLWVEGHPNEDLKTNWKYYLEEAEQEPDVQAQLAEIRKEYAAIRPENIKVIDPCMGSGHILVYLFEVLIQIYESYGYNTRDAAGLILKNNLYGLDIDDRAAQLAYFAVMMKARQYDRRIFSRGIQPHVHAIMESNGISRDVLDYFENGDPGLKKAMETIAQELRDAKEYGSILNVSQVDFAALYTRLDEIKNDINIFALSALNELRPLIEVAEAMAQKYDVVVTNPPYMNALTNSPKLAKYVRDNYPDSKSDLFAIFIEQGIKMITRNGFSSMVTMQSWMFLSSFKKMRKKLLNTNTITTLLHMDNMVMGIAFGTAVSVFNKRHLQKYKGTYNYIAFEDVCNDAPKQFPIDGNRFAQISNERFDYIPGQPIAYWLSDNFANAFKGESIKNVATPCIGMRTGDNDRFLRFWHEVPYNKIGFNLKNAVSAVQANSKWIPYHKGGSFRKWYGNNEYVVNWENDGKEIKDNTRKVYPQLGDNLGWKISNEQFYFQEGISWTSLSSGNTSFRRYKEGFIFSNSGQAVVGASSDTLDFLTALLNSRFSKEVLDIITPTMGFESGYIAKIPVVVPEHELLSYVINLSREQVRLSSNDWNSYETSWDFKRNPLAVSSIPAVFGAEHCGKYVTRLEDHYYAWKNECKERFENLQLNEEELNRIFNDIYGLQDELTPDVADKDVTVHRVFDSKDDVPESMKGSGYVRTKRDEIVSLISYAVGCMFGRYSLDVEGLAYAGGEWDASKYKTIIPDSDNIIPICDDDYFDDDITGHFVKWVETVYGKETLEENLKFIADALGGKGTPRDVIRSYFLNDFYSDHCKTYQKRPIYWLFDSGKKNGFKALIYMHRYKPDIIARMRTDYVHEQQSRYRTAIVDLEQRVNSASAGERVKLSKQLQKLQEQANEIRSYEEKIHHLADMMIPIDLDDGVKVNYAKFEDVLAKIK